MADDILAQCEADIRWKVVHQGHSLRSVSRHLQAMFPGVRGLSIRSVRQFCSSKGIRQRTTMTDWELDELVCSTVANVGHSYGRSLQGLLRGNGIRVSQHRLGMCL